MRIDRLDIGAIDHRECVGSGKRLPEDRFNEKPDAGSDVLQEDFWRQHGEV